MNQVIKFFICMALSLQAGAQGQLNEKQSSPSIINVKESPYNATGDGKADDSRAVQAAVTAAAVSGRVVWIPDGTFAVTDVMLPSNVTLDGVGTLELPVLPAGTNSSILVVVGTNVTIRNLRFDGNRSAQPADGFGDSFSTGSTSGRGRSYRAGIKADGAAQAVNNLTVQGCSFEKIYGACVAARNLNDLTIRNCIARSCNFELMFVDRTDTGYNTGITFVDNRGYDIGSGAPVVNGNFISIVRCRNVAIHDSYAQNVERCFAKLNGCDGATLRGIALYTNSASIGFSFLQLDAQTPGMSNRNITISQFVAYQVGKGVVIQGNEARNIVVTDGKIDTTTAADTPDAVLIGSTSATSDITVERVIITGAARYGIYVKDGDRINILDNHVGGGKPVAVNLGIVISAGSNMHDVRIIGNTVTNFNATFGGIYVDRPSTSTITNLIIQGNIVYTSKGSTGNGIRVTGKDWVTGLVTGNRVEGRIEVNQKDCPAINNDQTGVGSTTKGLPPRTNTLESTSTLHVQAGTNSPAPSSR